MRGQQFKTFENAPGEQMTGVTFEKRDNYDLNFADTLQQPTSRDNSYSNRDHIFREPLQGGKFNTIDDNLGSSRKAPNKVGGAVARKTTLSKDSKTAE